MKFLTLIVFSLLGFWLVDYLLSLRKNARQQPRRPAPEAEPAAEPVSELEQACRVLQITLPCSTEALKTAYRARMAEYHPDKVSTLGQELRELAERKSKEINAAYQHLLPLCS